MRRMKNLRKRGLFFPPSMHHVRRVASAFLARKRAIFAARQSGRFTPAQETRSARQAVRSGRGARSDTVEINSSTTAMNPNITPALPEPTEAEIQKKAYHLWLEGGCREGTELDNWFAAKELLMHHHGRVVESRPRPKPASRASAKNGLRDSKTIRFPAVAQG